MIRRDRNDITVDMIQYLKPLIQGEVKQELFLFCYTGAL